MDIHLSSSLGKKEERKAVDGRRDGVKGVFVFFLQMGETGTYLDDEENSRERLEGRG